VRIDTLLSTIILVSFLVTIVMAIGSYAAYKLREARRPRAEPPQAGAAAESRFYERIGAGGS
jgi:heme/copper-type cytochrome/quinol oxidase subunit 2